MIELFQKFTVSKGGAFGGIFKGKALKLPARQRRQKELKKILVCEDEAAIRDFVVINLIRGGYEVIEAENGEMALQKYDENNGDIDVALLDVMMPGMDAKTQEMDKVSALMNGADDYVTKPFSPTELVARVDALHRRVVLAKKTSTGNFSAEIKSGVFVLNLKSRALLKNGKIIELTQVEFQIMEYFFSNPGVALSRTSILKHVWGENYVGEEKIVDVNIRRLRMKIEDKASTPKYIVTVWGLGYKWDGKV